MNLTQEQLHKLFELASMEKRLLQAEITTSDITEALIEIERKIYSFSSEVKINNFENRKVLIADDLELSIYQLTTVLKKIGITPFVARHKDEAISEIIKAQFDCIIIDLFIPDSSDGFELIQEAVNRKNVTNSNSKIVVISGTDDNSLIEHSYELGVDFFIKKDKDWHSKLLKFLGSAFQNDNVLPFTKYTINNNIVTYSFKNFNDNKIFEEVMKSINSSIYTGMKHIVFDLQEVSRFSPDNAYILADIYKICYEHGGHFILVNPSENIISALSFAYLKDLIPTVKTIEEAIHHINTTNINGDDKEPTQ